MMNEDNSARTHIRDLRKNKFSIGAEHPNPLTQDLHHAVTCLSAELYTKDVHFLMELIQNAEDNQYADGVEPTLEFALTTKDITGCEAPITLLFFNNEVGFSRQNMESICSVGRSTKKGKKNQGFIGEKGIGFKSVFLVSKQPHIVSNGYMVKFNEEPDKQCGIGYIVPEWISDVSFISKIQEVYGSDAVPTTTIVLPLKSDKVQSVKDELASLHPEMLLFLSKLRRLYVHQESIKGKKSRSVPSFISILNETNIVVSKDQEADSRVIHLSVKAKPNALEEKCQYYIWRQAFPVPAEAKVGGRAHVEKWIVSLAFPFGKRLKMGSSKIGIFAFLPTSMVTNFPFMIQADFLLASSRETIVFDSKWNQGILNCVPLAFVSAFFSCVKGGSSVFNAAEAFKFLPTVESPFPALDKIRSSIQEKLAKSEIIPCDTFGSEITYRKPEFAVRIVLDFRKFLSKMKLSGISLAGISDIKSHPVHSSLDYDKYNPYLQFLSVGRVKRQIDWYGKCLATCNLVRQAPDDLYLDLLHFVFHNAGHFSENVDLLKYIDKRGDIKLCSFAKSKAGLKIFYGDQRELHAWLQKCNLLFGCRGNMYFLPNSVQDALLKHRKKTDLVKGFQGSANVKSCSVVLYSTLLKEFISQNNSNSKIVLMFCNFIYHSWCKGYLTKEEVSSILHSAPIIDGSGCVRTQRIQTLVPASESRWAKLLGPKNPFVEQSYVDIGEAYVAGGEFAGSDTSKNALMKFLLTHAEAKDLPELSLPDQPLQVASSLMTSDQTFLLLEWIRFHRTPDSSLPQSFIQSIKSGYWVKTTSGVARPSDCIIPSYTGSAMLDIVKNCLDGFSIIDQKFYGERLSLYTVELKFLGVRCGIDGVQSMVIDQFRHLSGSVMNRESAISLLKFMGFLKAKNMLGEHWLSDISCRAWLKTCTGHASPKDSVFLPTETEAVAAATVTRLNIIDVSFYGDKICAFTDELKLLGVKSEAEGFPLVAENLTFPDTPSSFSPNCGLFMLKCLRKVTSSGALFIKKLQGYRWLKTSDGFDHPSATILHNPKFTALLNIVKVPVIDEKVYGTDLRLYMDELKVLGVSVEFGEVLKIVLNRFKCLLSSTEAATHLIALLHCIVDMKKSLPFHQLDDMCKCLSGEEILKTRHGYKKPKESILFNSKWASISFFVDLPIIDDSHYGIAIYGLREELKMLGVLSSLEEGASFVAKGLKGPIETELLTAEGTLVLLDCLKNLMANDKENLCLKSFLDDMRASRIIKTSSGFKLPEETFLLHHDWKDKLEVTDAPFVDDKYYGVDMCAYQDELKTLGVKVDPMELCSVVSQSLPLLAETLSIKRIYGFLKEFQWKFDSQGTAESKIWIPVEDSNSEGEWVDFGMCVLHVKTQHFAPIIYSLDAYYEIEFLPFFKTAFGVKESPSTSHYFQIWSLWESRESLEISEAECCFFWEYILSNWNLKIEGTLKNNLSKVPVVSAEGGNLLVSKGNVFVPDDLCLKNLFIQGEDSPLFAWFPASSMFSVVEPRKLSKAYDALELRQLSKSVNCDVTIQQTLNQPDMNDLKKKLIVRGLLEIILSFLACKIHMPMKERHEAANMLLNLSVYESNGSVRVTYQLHSTADKFVQREMVKLVHWDKDSGKLYIDGSVSGTQFARAEFVNSFAAEVAKGLLTEDAVFINDLVNLIHLGFLYEFDERSIRFLLTRQNIQVFREDEEFLASVFPEYEGSSSKALEKRSSSLLGLTTLTDPYASQPIKKTRLNETAPAENEGKSELNTVQKQNQILLSCKKEADSTETMSGSQKPKRPKSAFFVFMEEFRKQYKLENPRNKSAASLSKAGGEKWRAMSDKEKAIYVETSNRLKIEYSKPVEQAGTSKEEPQLVFSSEETDEEDMDTEIVSMIDLKD